MTDTPPGMADAIRFLSMDAIARVGEGHPGTPLGAAEICTALWTRHLDHVAADPTWFDRDRFVLSAGHGSMLLYSLLHLTGHPGMTADALRNFRELGSPCEGHPERAPQHGVEVTTGLLGQGVANAAGMALAEAFLRATLGEDIVDHRTWVLSGDGCLQEGIAHEVAALAGHLRLGKLTWLWDDNRMTDDGDIALAMSEDFPARFRAAHWHVQEVDGHDLQALDAAMTLAKLDPRPSFIACRTVIGRGLPGVEGTRAAHSARIRPETVAAARAGRDWPHPPFHLPNAVADAWAQAGRRAVPRRDAWRRRVAALPPERRAELDRVMEGRLPEGWAGALRAYATDAAARGHADHGWKLSGDLLERAAAAIPELLAGAPDLEGATQHKRGLHAFTADAPAGRYVHYGVREHAMGAMLNGMAAHGGVVPTGVTYLVFSDYLRPVLRLAAMMRLPVVHAFTHDSIGIGRNGPTHQPIEHLASLRAIPGLHVFRPADAVEAAECWELALSRRDGPSALIFARQPLPAVRRDAAQNRSAGGAYVLRDTPGPRDVTLLATGSEVALALAAADLLAAERIAAAVVSMPCWALFEARPAAERAAILGTAPRLGIEAAARLGWDRWTGDAGGFLGMQGYGASGAEAELWRHFGLTPEEAAKAARALLH